MGAFVHGLARRGEKPAEYNVWAKMHQRCTNPSSPDFKNYGGRGISVCQRWARFDVFLSDMGSRPSAAHTIERVNNDLGYSPENCIWATRKVQANNKRPRARLSHCARGHILSEDNIYTRSNGKHACRACRAISMKRFYEKHKHEWRERYGRL